MAKNLLSWRWWNERVVEIPEHMRDSWMAPRWYLVAVSSLWVLVLSAWAVMEVASL